MSRDDLHSGRTSRPGPRTLERFQLSSSTSSSGETGEVAASVARSRRDGGASCEQPPRRRSGSGCRPRRARVPSTCVDGGRGTRLKPRDARQASRGGGENRAVTVEGGEHGGGCVAHARMPRRVLPGNQAGVTISGVQPGSGAGLGVTVGLRACSIAVIGRRVPEGVLRVPDRDHVAATSPRYPSRAEHCALSQQRRMVLVPRDRPRPGSSIAAGVSTCQRRSAVCVCSGCTEHARRAAERLHLVESPARRAGCSTAVGRRRRNWDGRSARTASASRTASEQRRPERWWRRLPSPRESDAGAYGGSTAVESHLSPATRSSATTFAPRQDRGRSIDPATRTTELCDVVEPLVEHHLLGR